jgi:membrane protease YdiL (CAAX protease family)
MSNQAHPGWRLLAFLLLFFFLAGLASAALAALGLAPAAELPKGSELAEQAPVFLLMLLCAALTNFLIGKSLGPCLSWSSDFAPARLLGHGCRGAALGLALAGVVGALLGVSGRATYAPGEPPAPLVWAGLLATLLLSAALEELLFRGVLLRLLDQGLGRGWAVAFSALAFGGIHAARASSGIELALISLVSTTLAGLLLGLAFVRCGTLWLPMGLHAAWNLGLGPLLGLPVSGIQFANALVSPQLHAQDWFAGGSYGPEGGVAGILAILLGCVAMLRLPSLLGLPLAPWRGPDQLSLQP